MYSINKYKLLRHTLFRRQSWEWFHRPSTFSLHPYAIQSGYTANNLSTCWPAGRLVRMFSHVFTAGRETGMSYTAHRHGYGTNPRLSSP